MPHDPESLTPYERRQALAAILATSLLRLAERHAMAPPPPAENLPENLQPPLEAARNVPLTVHAG